MDDFPRRYCTEALPPSGLHSATTDGPELNENGRFPWS